VGQPHWKQAQQETSADSFSSGLLVEVLAWSQETDRPQDLSPIISYPLRCIHPSLSEGGRFFGSLAREIFHEHSLKSLRTWWECRGSVQTVRQTEADRVCRHSLHILSSAVGERFCLTLLHKSHHRTFLWFPSSSPVSSQPLFPATRALQQHLRELSPFVYRSRSPVTHLMAQ
jgi:hypothetical protein